MKFIQKAEIVKRKSQTQNSSNAKIQMVSSDILRTRGETGRISNFLNFVWTSFMDGPLVLQTVCHHFVNIKQVQYLFIFY